MSHAQKTHFSLTVNASSCVYIAQLIISDSDSAPLNEAEAGNTHFKLCKQMYIKVEIYQTFYGGP